MIDEFPKTMSVPEAGKRYFDLSRNGAYDAAARGDIPTIRIGRLLRVPVQALEKMMDNASEQKRAACRSVASPHEAQT
jgi:Helix-turn-helix domain